MTLGNVIDNIKVSLREELDRLIPVLKCQHTYPQKKIDHVHPNMPCLSKD